MITFNGKPLCDHCHELPMAHTYDGWELCNNCLLIYDRWIKMQEDAAIGYNEESIQATALEEERNKVAAWSKTVTLDLV
jgi:hypothetical protein